MARILYVCFCCSVVFTLAKRVTIRNDVPRFDVAGNYLDAHDGCIVAHDGTYFLYGEAYGTVFISFHATLVYISSQGMRPVAHFLVIGETHRSLRFIPLQICKAGPTVAPHWRVTLLMVQNGFPMCCGVKRNNALSCGEVL